MSSNTSIVSICISKVVFAPLAGLEMQVMQMFQLFFHNPFIFVYRHFNLEGSGVRV
jgi:hypothetical protein